MAAEASAGSGVANGSHAAAETASDRAGPPLGEGGLVVLAAATWVGAALAPAGLESRWALVLAAFLLVVPVLLRRPLLAAGALLVLGGHVGAAAAASWREVEPGPFDGTATVVGDPELVGAATAVELRLADGRRVRATGYGRAGTGLAGLGMGERVEVQGRLRAIGDRPWLRTRHVTGLASIDRVEVVGQPSVVVAVPELLRERIAAGAATMAPDRRSLYLGLVIGDDRAQTLGQRLRFRAAGLTHLLAVSGQNVAFVLAVARPLLAALGYRARYVGLLAALVAFALITRLEPSVLRATATAAIAAWAAMSGRPRSGLAVLSLAVIALLLVDPFLVGSVGFQLSVAASAGILLLSPTLERRLPGPPWLVLPAATTLSAQLGVSPLLALHFGPVSAATVPANLLAGWAAAVIMTIGLTVGVVAGLLPAGAARLLQLPAQGLLWWIETVATVHATVPAPRLGPLEVLGLGGLGLAARSARLGRGVRLAVVAVGVAVLVAAVPRPGPAGACGPGIGWYPDSHDHPAVLVITPAAGDAAVEACVASGIRHVDLVVAQRGSARTARLVGALGELVRIDRIVAPPSHRIIGATRLTEGVRVPIETGFLRIEPADDGAELLVSREARAQSRRGRAPPLGVPPQLGVSRPGRRSGGGRRP